MRGLNLKEIMSKSNMNQQGLNIATYGQAYSTRRSFLFFVPYFPARLDFSSPPLSAPGSPRMEKEQMRGERKRSRMKTPAAMQTAIGCVAVLFF